MSHALKQVEKLCDKTIWMHYGGVREFGPTTEIMAHYKEFIRWFKKLSKKEQKNIKYNKKKSKRILH
ncbi:teichoic acid export ATP-binding protein [Tetragenococcus muriaticus PMC-11-5]|uniref:Teichoic acid export ATP-binding protein n=1 Tax=Tetragenococcus muriaticus PMC-11-5 TaxID=1302649 RepID=A0A091C338_9ENTE|nr:teichoic acid export ATP-binding protein [Tetragenococcus muriaticus PMC-11-5]